MRKLIYILILFLSPLAGVLANLAPRPHPNMSLIDQRLPRQLLLVGDEYPIYWYNKADDNEWYWWSMRADANMVTDANYVWPFAAGDAGDVLFIRQIENTAEVYLDWGLFDANWVVVDGNEFTFPTKTPWNVMYVGSDGYPLTEDPNYFTYYAPERAFGVGIEYIGAGLYANNYIQVYSLLDFEPNLFNVTIGMGSDDVTTGPNNVRIGHGAAPSLATGIENTLGGKDAGRWLADSNDNAGWGYKAIGGSGDGSLNGEYTQYLVGINPYSGTKIVAMGKDDSTIDTTWGTSGYWDSTPYSGPSYCIYQLADGKILVAHGSSKVSMINTNGTTDTTWAVSGVYSSQPFGGEGSGPTIRYILEDAGGNFHMFGGVTESGYSYQKVSSAGVFITGITGQYNRPRNFDCAVWADDEKTRILAVTGEAWPINTGSEYVYVNVMAINPTTGTKDTTWTGNKGFAGFAQFENLGSSEPGIYKIFRMSDSRFVGYRNDANTFVKFLADGSALDTSWGTNGILTLNAASFGYKEAINPAQDGDELYVLIVESRTGDAFDVLYKISATGIATEITNWDSPSGNTYHSVQVFNNKLILGTGSAAPATYNVEIWTKAGVYESGFDVLTSNYVWWVIPDETTREAASYDVHRVAAFGNYAASNIVVGADDGLYVGNYSGEYNTTDPNRFFLDNLDRGTYLGNKEHGMMYGYFADDPNDQWLNINADVNFPQLVDMNELEVDSIEAVVDINSPIYYVGDSGTYITKDGSYNMTLTDAVVGTKTLKQLGSPTYLYIKATAQAEGDLHLFDATKWGASKVFITQIRVVTSSTDWDLYLLQNDNGYAADDANIGKFCRVTEVNGNATLKMDHGYEDEDASAEVHLYWNDVGGANTADFYIIGFSLN